MNQLLAYCLFETSLGVCGIAWREPVAPEGPPKVALFQLPEATPALTEERIARESAGRRSAPPPAIASLMDRVCRHLAGDPQDFRDITLSLDGLGSFAQRVYAAARDIPAGQTRTYGQIAKEIDCPAAARAVGQALGKNPIALLIPCHRVLAANGKAGGFSAHGGPATKAKMLAIEGVTIG